MKIQWAPGKTPLIPEELAPTLLDWIRQGPRACGLKRANWTHVALAHHLLDVARAYPADEYPEVVLVIDNAPGI